MRCNRERASAVKKKKVNPNRIPATQADVERAKKFATTSALRKLLYLMLYILIDKHEAPKEDIHRLAAEVNYYADSISQGYITWKDVEHVVVDEYGIELPW